MKDNLGIKVGITIEGSDGLTWPIWKRLAKKVEECGYHGLYRSDHYIANTPPDKASLELWVSLTWLADHTKLIEFGPLVTPISFQHPTMTARMAAAVDDLSNGRLLLGLGAGGWSREHHMFGLNLLEVPDHMKRFKEGAKVVKLLLTSDKPVSYSGDFYNLRDAILLPSPIRPGGPPILIGGNGKKYTLPIAAQLGDEWNCVYQSRGEFIQLNSYLDDLIEMEDRNPRDVERSMLTGCIFGRTKSAVENKIDLLVPKDLPPEMKRAVIIGDGGCFVDRIFEMSEAGLEKIILVWYDLNDFEGLELLAKEVFK